MGGGGGNMGHLPFTTTAMFIVFIMSSVMMSGAPMMTSSTYLHANTLARTTQRGCLRARFCVRVCREGRGPHTQHPHSTPPTRPRTAATQHAHTTHARTHHACQHKAKISTRPGDAGHLMVRSLRFRMGKPPPCSRFTVSSSWMPTSTKVPNSRAFCRAWMWPTCIPTQERKNNPLRTHTLACSGHRAGKLGYVHGSGTRGSRWCAAAAGHTLASWTARSRQYGLCTGWRRRNAVALHNASSACVHVRLCVHACVQVGHVQPAVPAVQSMRAGTALD
jgi:hypothetical protein